VGGVGSASNPACTADVGGVGGVAYSKKYLLGFLWGLFGWGYIPYTPYIVFFFCEKEGVLPHQLLVDTQMVCPPAQSKPST